MVEHGAQRSAPLEAPCRGAHRERQHGDAAGALEAAREVEVLEERPLAVAAELFEGGARRELRLVAERHAGAARAGVGEGADEAEQWTRGLEAHAKTAAPTTARDPGAHRVGGAFWQLGVGMEEE